MLAYCRQLGNRVSPGASRLASITKTLVDQLADRGITLNTVNPGPVDTGYAAFADKPEVHEAIRRHFPQGRWGTPTIRPA